MVGDDLDFGRMVLSRGMMFFTPGVNGTNEFGMLKGCVYMYINVDSAVSMAHDEFWGLLGMRIAGIREFQAEFGAVVHAAGFKAVVCCLLGDTKRKEAVSDLSSEYITDFQHAVTSPVSGDRD